MKLSRDEISVITMEWYDAGKKEGEYLERERIVKRLRYEASEWLSHHGSCDCRVRGLEVERLIEIIEGERE